MEFTTLLTTARAHAGGRIEARRSDGEDIAVGFAEFLDSAEQLAGRLRAAGLVRGMQIGLQAPNVYEYLVWDLAAVALGAVLQAVPEDLPADKVAGLVEKRDVALWVYEKAENFAGVANAAPLAAALDGSALPLDAAAAVLADADLHSRVYSSGSSGYLKGLNISRRGTEVLVSDFVAAFGLCASDSHLIFLPLSNYQQRLSVYGCLWSGASFKLVRHTAVFQELGRYKPSFIVAPPAIYENIYALYGRGPDAKDKLNAFLGGNIRFMITGMAPIRGAILTAFNQLGLRLLEAYGVTETGMIAWNTPRNQRIGSVGLPIHPEQLHFTPESEIVIRRPHPLSKGYFDSSESDSSSTFLADGAIATGDIGALDADGYLSLSGRKKEIIVTSGGTKFHPEEIERSLASIEVVRHAVVLMSRSDNRLVAVLVVPDSKDAAALRLVDDSVQAINAAAPSYRSIHRRVLTETLPSIENGMLTRNLKYDRKGVYRLFQAEIEQQG